MAQKGAGILHKQIDPSVLNVR